MKRRVYLSVGILLILFGLLAALVLVMSMGGAILLPFAAIVIVGGIGFVLMGIGAPPRTPGPRADHTRER